MKKIKHVSISNQRLLFLNLKPSGTWTQRVTQWRRWSKWLSSPWKLFSRTRRTKLGSILPGVPGFNSPFSLQGTHLHCGRQRSLSGSYDFLESNRGVTSKTFCSTLLFQLRRLINLCEKSIPMRHKGVHYIHLPFFVNAMFNFVKGILSVKIQNRCQGDARQNEILYLGSASTRAWMNWWKMFAVSKGFPRNTEAPFLCRQWPGEC